MPSTNANSKSNSVPTAFCCVHGTGGSFYSSTLFDFLAEKLLATGSAVLKVNTRGHDLMSTASLQRGGGRRLGAAYEVVADCLHDLAAWSTFLRERVSPNVVFLGHSLGAVKALFALAHDAQLASRVIAVSPPRLAYSWFAASSQATRFLETYRQARELVNAGEPNALLEVQIPLPFVITAAGYVEKYGPDERYDFVKHLPRVTCPTLLTLGESECANNPAFQGVPELVHTSRQAHVQVEVVPRADHFYTGVRAELWQVLARWLGLPMS